MRKNVWVWVAYIFVYLFTFSNIYGDILYLSEGRKIEGKILSINSNMVRIKTNYNIVMAIPRDEIEKIEKEYDIHEEFQKRWNQSQEFYSANQFYQLGSWCLKKNLKKEAKRCFQKALKINPDHEKARYALGYIYLKGKWVLKSKRRSNTFGYTSKKKTFISSKNRKNSQPVFPSISKWPRTIVPKQITISKKLSSIFTDPKARATSWDMTKEVIYGRYRIRSNLKAKYIRIYARFLNKLFLSYSAVFRFPYWRYPSYKCKVWIFATKKEFQDYLYSDEGPGLTGAAGFYQGVVQRIVTYHGLFGEKGNTFTILAHEGAHQFQDLSLKWSAYINVPIWLSEGMACLFESMYFDGKKLVLGKVNQERLENMKRRFKNNKYISLERLFRTPQAYFDATCYDHAWAFLYWLIYSNKGRNKRIFDAMWLYCRKKKLTPGATKRFLGTDLKKIEEKWKKWILNLDPNFQFKR